MDDAGDPPRRVVLRLMDAFRFPTPTSDWDFLLVDRAPRRVPESELESDESPGPAARRLFHDADGAGGGVMPSLGAVSRRMEPTLEVTPLPFVVGDDWAGAEMVRWRAADAPTSDAPLGLFSTTWRLPLSSSLLSPLLSMTDASPRLFLVFGFRIDELAEA